MLQKLHMPGFPATVLPVIVIILFVAGCGSPHGLVDDMSRGGASDTAGADATGILVLPPSGIAPTVARNLSRAMVWGLREAGYPAQYASAPDGINRTLTGWIEEASAGADIAWVNFDWAIYDPTGQLDHAYRQEMALSRPGWENGSHNTLGIIAMEAVPRIHDMINSRTPNRATTGSVPTTLVGSRTTGGTIVISGNGIEFLSGDNDRPVERISFGSGHLPEPGVFIPPPGTVPPSGENARDRIVRTNGQPVFLVRESVGAPGDGINRGGPWQTP